MKGADFSDKRIYDPLPHGLCFIRNQYGIWTNIPHVVTHHSPTGYEWGYGGSGPADLALNILENILKLMGHKGDRVPCWDGDCYQLAWTLHQAFKWEFISGMPAMGCVIPYATVTSWVKVVAQAV